MSNYVYDPHPGRVTVVSLGDSPAATVRPFAYDSRPRTATCHSGSNVTGYTLSPCIRAHSTWNNQRTTAPNLRTALARTSVHTLYDSRPDTHGAADATPYTYAYDPDRVAVAATGDSAATTVYAYAYDPRQHARGATNATHNAYDRPTPPSNRATNPNPEGIQVETGVYYYGYRYYIPELGRWPSRDPIEEDGGLNVYGFAGNRPISLFDLLGLDYLSICPPGVIDPDTSKVWWVVTTKDGTFSTSLLIGNVDRSFKTINLTAEYDSKTISFIDAGFAAGHMIARFGAIDTLSENIQKSAIALALEHPTMNPEVFTSLDDAGIWGCWLARGRAGGVGEGLHEWGGWITFDGGMYRHGKFVTSHLERRIRYQDMPKLSETPNVVGSFHNHTVGGEYTSGGDAHSFNYYRRYTSEINPDLHYKASFFITPQGVVRKIVDVYYDPNTYRTQVRTLNVYPAN